MTNMESNNWEQEFAEIAKRYDLGQKQSAMVKSFISEILSELINEIPDSVRNAYEPPVFLDGLKQQLKDKYGIR